MPSKIPDLCLPLIVGVPKLKSKDVRIQIGNSVDDIEVGLIPGAYRGDGGVRSENGRPWSPAIPHGDSMELAILENNE